MKNVSPRFIELVNEAVTTLAALEACAAADLLVIRVQRHYKSHQAFLGRRSAPGTPAWVVKDVSSAEKAHNEHEALGSVAKVFGDGRSRSGFRFGAIRSVAAIEDPPGLVTAYQPGRSMRPEVDAGLRTLAGPESVERAAQRVGAMAAWLATLKSSGVIEGGGLTPERYEGVLKEHLAAARRHLGRHRGLDVAERCAERCLEAMEPAERTRLGNLYPGHGDLCAQNFLIDDDDVIYALDLGAFGHYHTDIDLAAFRMRLEHAILRGLFVRSRAERLWQTFLGAYGEQADGLHGLLSYLLEVLWNLGSRAATRARPSLTRRVAHLPTAAGQAIWTRARLAWLRQLSGTPADNRRFFCEHL